MAKSASEIRTLLPCPLCGRMLVPTSGDPAPAFYCKSGHRLALAELLKAQSAAVKGGLEVLLADWEHQHQALLDTEADARLNGFPDVAEIFHRHAKSLGSRIEKVRAAFSQTESSKVINLSDLVRPA